MTCKSRKIAEFDMIEEFSLKLLLDQFSLTGSYLFIFNYEFIGSVSINDRFKPKCLYIMCFVLAFYYDRNIYSCCYSN